MTGSGDLSEFVRGMTPAMHKAAAIARALEGRVENRPKSGETSPAKQALTVADTAAQEALLVRLIELAPDVRVEAEEDTPSVAHFSQEAESLVVIDPVDGTLHSYLGKKGPYAVMLGLAVGGRYEASLIALPREGLFLDATRGGGANIARAASASRKARVEADGKRILVSNATPPAVFEELGRRGFEVIPACGGAVAVAPLLAGVRAGLRWATGGRGISIRGRIGALIAREAGALVRGTAGASFPDDLDTPAPALLVSAEEEDLRVMEECLVAAGLS